MNFIIKEGPEERNEKAAFAQGCFWGAERVYRRMNGVISTQVGYMGGHVKNPTYREVSSGTTGHAETVQVIFDPIKIKYEELLDLFWENHDPTTLNRQGPDRGTQYRSVIFYYTAEQESAARRSKEKRERSGRYPSLIVTRIEKAGVFWKAEDYHQQYFEKMQKK